MTLLSIRPARVLGLLLAATTLCSGTAFGQAAPPSPSDPPPNTGPYQMYWAATGLIPTNGEPYEDWALAMNFGDVPVRRDITVLYQSDGGLYPYAGIHQVESDPDWMRRHYLRLQHTISLFIPDPNQGGYGVIDYEEWSACWSLLENYPSNQGPNARDKDFKDDWRDYLRQHRPDLLQGRPAAQHDAIFEQTYNDAVRRFFVATINECKRLRPNMQWGFYLFPPRSYYNMLTEEGRSVWAAKHRPYLGWLYECQDAFFPDVYALYYTVHDRQPDIHAQEDPAWQFEEYVRWNIIQAEELANGKPVIAFVYIRYHENCTHYSGQVMNDFNLEKSFALPKQYGAEGVALWEAIDSSARAAEGQAYITQKVVPAIRAHFTDAAGNSLMPPAPSGNSTTPPDTSGNSANSSTTPPSTGNEPNDPLRTRPYVSVQPNPDPPAPTVDTGSGQSNISQGSSQPTEPHSASGSDSDDAGGSGGGPELHSRRNTINVPRNVRNGRNATRNPAWPAIVQRNVNTTR